jgi:hypothetical protein
VKTFRLAPLLIALVAVSALPATASAKKQNPYTAAGVCGPGYKPIDRHKLVDSNHGKLIAEIVLTYNAATGKNCAVNLKRYRVGVAEKYNDWMYVTLYTRPLRNPANLDSDKGDFNWYAGPVYVSARDKCVQWGGGADLIVPANWSPRGKFYSHFRSRWTHCK